MALANGLSKMKTGQVTQHTRRAIYVAEKLTSVSEARKYWIILNFFYFCDSKPKNSTRNREYVKFQKNFGNFFLLEVSPLGFVFIKCQN